MTLIEWLASTKRMLRISAAPSPEFYYTIDRILSTWNANDISKKKYGDANAYISMQKTLKKCILDLTRTTTIVLSAAKGGDPVTAEAAEQVLTDLSNVANTIQDITL